MQSSSVPGLPWLVCDYPNFQVHMQYSADKSSKAGAKKKFDTLGLASLNVSPRSPFNRCTTKTRLPVSIAGDLMQREAERSPLQASPGVAAGNNGQPRL